MIKIISLLTLITLTNSFYILPNEVYKYRNEYKQKQINWANQCLNILEKESYVNFHLLNSKYESYTKDYYYNFVNNFILSDKNKFESLYLFCKCVNVGYDYEYLNNFLY